MSYKGFTQIKNSRPSRSNFDLSHEVKLSTEFGRLTPILCQEVLPSDRWIGKTELFVRLAPMLAPIMHQVNVYTHFFYVPNRIVWDNWNNFIEGKTVSGDVKGDDFYQPPFLSIPVRNGSSSAPESQKYLKPGQLADYLGVPIYDENIFNGTSPSGIEVNALPFRAYQLIWNEYYRDENLQDEIDIKSGVDASQVAQGDFLEHLKIRHRAWEKDYFTSALPWPQKGPDVNIPLDGETKLTIDGTQNDISSYSMVYTTDGKPVEANLAENLQVNNRGVLMVNNKTVRLVTSPVTAQTTGVTNATINSLRWATKLQEFLEKDARGGTRETEILYSHFGVKADDLRLNRPQYLGGGKTNVVISEVLQQSSSTQDSNLGEMGGHGVTVGVTHKFHHSFKEHGWIIGILSIMPRSSYQQGLHRQFTRKSRYDYAWPEFAHLGEQNILSQELFYNYDLPTQNLTDFGYAPRYSEYKFINSSVHGDMATNLDFWHLGRKFTKTPNLNEDFITCKATDNNEVVDNQYVGLNRIFAVTQMPTDHFWIQVYNRITVKRPLPYYGTPLL